MIDLKIWKKGKRISTQMWQIFHKWYTYEIS